MACIPEKNPVSIPRELVDIANDIFRPIFAVKSFQDHLVSAMDEVSVPEPVRSAHKSTVRLQIVPTCLSLLRNVAKNNVALDWNGIQ